MNIRAFRAFSTEVIKMAAKQQENAYDRAKSVVMPTVIGGATAGGLTRLGQRVMGVDPSANIGPLRVAVPIGAAVGLADAMYQRHRQKQASLDLGTAGKTFTPARQLQAATEVRRRDKTIVQGVK